MPLPVDHGENRDPGSVAESDEVTVFLDEASTSALLQEVPRAFHSQINDALLAALALAVSGWTGRPEVLIDLEGHGREEIADGVDLSRTVGWFTTIFPVHLELPAGRDPGQTLQAVKEQWRQVPGRGIGYGMLRYLSEDLSIVERLRTSPGAEIAFNYLGQIDQVLPGSFIFQPARESAGPARAPIEPSGTLAGRARPRRGREAPTGLAVPSWRASSGNDRGACRRLPRCSAVVRGTGSIAGGPRLHSFRLSPGRTRPERRSTACSRASGRSRTSTPSRRRRRGCCSTPPTAPDSGVYVQQWTGTLRGVLDAPAFEAAWQQVVARHPVLRTSFHWADPDRPVQVVHRQVETPLERLDWRDVPGEEQEARLAAFLKADRERGFVASWAPLARLALIRLGEDVQRLVLTYHHTILDGWCMPILFSEALALYESGRQGREIALPAPRPYRDYIAWLQGQDAARSESYWRETLRGFRAPTSLGIDRSESLADGRAESRGERFMRLSAATTAALQSLARTHQLTLNTLVQGAWALLLGRYSGQDDVVFGVTVSGRPAELPGAETMVGLFINTLPSRVRVDEEAALLPWLDTIQASQVAMREHEPTPLLAVQGWSELPRGRPLFESLVVFENYPVDAALAERAGSLGIESSRILERTNFPLTLMVAPGAELTLRADFDASRFDSESIERMLGHLRNLLEAIADDPDRRLADLPMLSDAEQEQLLRLAGQGASPLVDGDVVNLDDLSDEELDLLLERLGDDTGSERHE